MSSIAIESLLFLLLPVGAVGYVYYRWVGARYEVGYGIARMVTQLLLIGYVLSFIFASDSPLVGMGIVLFMIAVSSWIALRHFAKKSAALYATLFASIALGGTLNLFIVLVLVLKVEPFFKLDILVPLAGMIYANAMNAVSVGAERFENDSHLGYEKARAHALRAALIPQMNALLAVGLVSLPGMMTGQILSGVDPLIAARYQIMVMAMVIGSAGISTILFLGFQKNKA